MVVAQSGALRSGLFRTFDIGWLEGIDGGCPSGALRSDTFPNFRLRVAVGDVAVLRSVATALPKC